MSLIAVIFTVFLMVNCLMLILLILVQLPKKDAGAGLAFGGGTADALFGAGSGNVLTKITKWATVAFLLLALVLGYMQNSAHNQNNAADFAKKVQEKQMQSTAPTPAPAPTGMQPATQATPAAAPPTATIPAAISGAAASVSNNAAK